MYPKSYLLLFLAYFPFLLFSQNIRFGLKGGLNLSRDKFELYSQGIPLNLNTEVAASYHFGGLMEFYLEDSRTVLQMEFLYTGNGMLIRENELSKRKRFNLTQITIPLVFKFEAKEDLYFNGGSYFGRILTTQELNSLGQTSNIKDRFQLFDLGFLLGFEFKVNQRLSFDLRYNYGLLNFNNADAYEGSETERLYKNRTVNYGMVYKF